MRAVQNLDRARAQSGAGATMRNNATKKAWRSIARLATRAARPKHSIQAGTGGGLGDDLGNIACALQEFEEALRLDHESRSICQEMGDSLGVPRSLTNLGMVAHGQKRYAEARRYHQESLAIKQQIGDQRGAIHSFNHPRPASLS